MPNQRLKNLVVRIAVIGLGFAHVLVVATDVSANYPDRVIRSPRYVEPFPQFFKREVRASRGYRYGSAAVKTVYRNFFDLKSQGAVGGAVQRFHNRTRSPQSQIRWIRPVQAAALPTYRRTATRRTVAVAFNTTARPRRTVTQRRIVRRIYRPIAYRRYQ